MPLSCGKIFGRAAKQGFMRKLELALVIVLVAVAAAWWSHKPAQPDQPATVTATPVTGPLTRSGRYEILVPRYSLAGVPIGSGQSEVLAALGMPTSESGDGKETLSWSYERDGQKLTVTFLEDRVIAVGGSGRWQFAQAGQPARTLFMQTEKTILENLGKPRRTEKNVAVYDSSPGELTIHFSSSGTVEQFWLTGEVKPVAQK